MCRWDRREAGVGGGAGTCRRLARPSSSPAISREKTLSFLTTAPTASPSADSPHSPRSSCRVWTMSSRDRDSTLRPAAPLLLAASAAPPACPGCPTRTQKSALWGPLRWPILSVAGRLPRSRQHCFVDKQAGLTSYLVPHMRCGMHSGTRAGKRNLPWGGGAAQQRLQVAGRQAVLSQAGKRLRGQGCLGHHAAVGVVSGPWVQRQDARQVPASHLRRPRQQLRHRPRAAFQHPRSGPHRQLRRRGGGRAGRLGPCVRGGAPSTAAT